MEKIALDVLHEVELYSNSDLDDFTAQLFLINKDGIQFGFDLKREKKNENIFTFKIPKSLAEFVKDPVKYKVYVYLDNARFLADDGDLQVISQDQFKGGKIVNPAQDVKFSAKIKNEDSAKEKETNTETKPKTKEATKPKPKEETKPKENKSDKESSVTETKKPTTSKENINLDEIFDQHKNIKDELNTNDPRKAGKSLRDYAERVERNKKLSENKEELNEKVKNILASFNTK